MMERSRCASGNSLGSSDRSMAGPLRTPAAMVRSMNQDTLEMLEYPFITMQHYPSGFILHIGNYTYLLCTSPSRDCTFNRLYIVFMLYIINENNPKNKYKSLHN